MKTSGAGAAPEAAPIVQLLGAEPAEAAPVRDAGEVVGTESDAGEIARARAFAQPLLEGQRLGTGEPAMAHAQGVEAILQAIGSAPSLRAATYLVYAAEHLAKPEEVIGQSFGASYTSLVVNTARLVRWQRTARAATLGREAQAQQIERVRKMLLAFSRDLRVVLLRLASRLQTLRFFAAEERVCDADLAAESMQVFAPLANRLGIWQIKWELEDLSFRVLEPAEYRRIARLLDERRVEREARVDAVRRRLAGDLAAHGVFAEVQGRPKHLYGIWKKMQGKRLGFAQVLDQSAVRVIVREVAACYAVLGRVHERFRAVAGEFDDYIERPKANGYQSLHTVVLDDDGRAVEVQIRTQAMHEHAEHGVAAHWAYKDAGAKGYAGVNADAGEQLRVAEARKAVLRQLFAWERDTAELDRSSPHRGDDRVYVFTPAATVVELAAGATPVDFAYAVHTELGHRCRGARVEGAIVPLNTPLLTGQTVEVIAAKDGGPSLDWLNAGLGYLRSPRSRAKVRAWFNGLARRQTAARGRETVEKLLQREGKTAIKLNDLATRLGFRDADALFELVGKDEYSLRNIETLLRPADPPPSPDEAIAVRRSTGVPPRGGVLVVGVESLMTNLARCCRPAPPDPIVGFVTRGKGVTVHRSGCSNFRHLATRTPERVIAVTWGAPRGDKPALYPIDVRVEAADRQGLLRDLSELFAKEKMNVTAVTTQLARDASGATTWMTFTLEVADASRLARVIELAHRIAGVRSARRGSL